MKISIILIAALFFSVCDRPPQQKDTQPASVDHSKMDHSKMDHGNMDHSTMNSSPGAAEQPFDLQFLDTMIAHHQGAVDMADLVKTRSRFDGLNKLAASVLADQAKEIAQMRQWRGELFAGRPEAMNMDLAGMRDGMKGMDMQRLSALKERQFDIEFVRQMIPHHEGAVVMAQEALNKASDERIKQLAASVISSQNAEIKTMQGWLADWEKQ